MYPVGTKIRFARLGPDMICPIREISGQEGLDPQAYIDQTAVVEEIWEGLEEQVHVVRFADGTVGHLLPGEIEIGKPPANPLKFHGLGAKGDRRSKPVSRENGFVIYTLGFGTAPGIRVEYGYRGPEDMGDLSRTFAKILAAQTA